MTPARPRYRFGEFVVSPSRRILFKAGREIPLIPRYFDLLLLLLERRNQAVHRKDLLDVVWSDVVVSDGALNQAIRVLRRALGDDPKDSVFIGTVSRHGYRFVHPGVVEEADEEARALASQDVDELEVLVDKLLEPGGDLDEHREAAERLHALGTAEALRRIGGRPGHARARAFLRDARWAVPGAGEVPIVGQPGSLATAWLVARMRLRRAVRLAGRRWLTAVIGAGIAGFFAGALGGMALYFGPGGSTAESVLIALPVIGTVFAALAACGVGGGLATAEVVTQSGRGLALVLGGAVGGFVMGTLFHFAGLPALQSMFGGDLSHLAGGLEGLVLGGAIGLGYALATPTPEGGMATPRGWERLRAALVAGAIGSAAGLVLVWNGSYLAATSLEFVALRFPGSDVSLAPVARLLGEPRAGVRTHLLLSGVEGFLFGFGLVLGLTRRAVGRREE